MIVTAAELRAVLDDAASEFRRIDGLDQGVTYKADGSPLTAADLGIDRFLRHRLASVAPEAGWLSEESRSVSPLPPKWTWVVDPLDGTKEYARRIPECAVSIGLVEGDRIRAGAVMNPMNGNGAAAGTDGSWLQWPSAAESVAPALRLGDAAASVSRTEIEDGSAQPYLRLVGHVRPVGSVANKLMRTACGIDDLTFSVQPKSIWDVCGGIALLEARGMVFSRLDGQPNLFDAERTRVPMGFAAGPPAMVDELIGELRAHMGASHEAGR